jgi:hypothetical protein
MRLIGKSHIDRNGYQWRLASGDQCEGLPRPNFSAKRSWCDAKHPAEAARDGFGRKTVAPCPAVETAVGIAQNISCENIGPISECGMGLTKLGPQ